MSEGKLEVLLIGAKGLENTDFLFNMDPYVIVTFRTQEQKSSVAAGTGSDPEWNETFIFTVYEFDDNPKLSLKIMDSDTGTADDFVGEAKVPLDAVFESGSVPPSVYNVVKDEQFRGEIRVGLSYTSDGHRDRHDRRDSGYYF